MKFWNKSVFLILAFALLLRLNFTLFTPNWQATDEYPHFFVIKYLSIYENYPKSNINFPYYEAYQPHLYYQLASLLYKISKDYDKPGPEINQQFDPDTLTHPLNLSLFILRLLSVVLGMLTLILIYGVAYIFFKNYYAIYTLMIASTLPTFVVNNSSVTNDALANFLGALILFLMIKCYYNSQNKLLIKGILLGIVLGLALQTKANLYPFLLIILVGLYFSKVNRIGLLRNYIIILIIAILLSLNYFYTNYQTYGSLLPISPDSEKGYFFENISLSRVYHALRNYFWSFWAAAGRIYQIHLQDYQYLILFFPLTIISLLGNIKYFLKKNLKCDVDYKKYIFIVFSVIVFSISALYFYFLFEKHTAWGRYLYPNLASYLILLVFGLTQILEEKYTKLTFLYLFAIQVIINVYFLFTLTKIP